MKVNRDEYRILICEWEAFKVDQKMCMTDKEEIELFLDTLVSKEIYEANGIEQPFQGSRELTKKDVDRLLWIYGRMIEIHGEHPTAYYMIEFAEIIDILDEPYHNESILKQIAEYKAKIEELEKQLK